MNLVKILMCLLLSAGVLGESKLPQEDIMPTCLRTLDEKDKNLYNLTLSSIETAVKPELPRDEITHRQVESAMQTDGVVECVIIKFKLDKALKVHSETLVSDNYNRRIARNAVRALRSYKFKESTRLLEGIVIIEFKVE